MAETKARFLANLIGADNTANDFTLPNSAVSGTNNKVLTSGGDGTVTWEITLSAPTITSVTTTESGDTINEDSDVTMTVTGTNFADAGMTAKLVDASDETSVVTGHDTSDLSVNYTNATSISVTTRAATANISQSNVKLVITKSGLSATSASIGVSPDPTFTSISNPHATLVDNLGSGQNVGSAISASASDGASITYSISGATSAGNTYIINSTSGQITTPSAGIADVSSGTSYSESPVVTATAGGDSTRTHTLSVPLVIQKYLLKLFSGATWTGNQTVRTISFSETNAAGGANDFAPDFVWIKNREVQNNFYIVDSVRGAGKRIQSNSTTTESSADTDIHSGFSANGFELGTSSSNNANKTDDKYIGWAFQAGGEPSGNFPSSIPASGLANGTLVADSGNGSASAGYSDISNVTNVKQSINLTKGFSITMFNGHATSGQVPHNLGNADVIWIKNLDSSESWLCWHNTFTGSTPDYLRLQDGGAKVGGSSTHITADPTSLNYYSFGSDPKAGGSTDRYIMYAWKSVAGVSKFSSYSGNSQTGASGRTVDCDFFPRFVLIKCHTDAANWIVWDSFRSDADSSGDIMLPRLRVNTDEVETSGSNEIRLYDDGAGTKGFQLRTDEGGLNNSSRGYVYMAFA